ncbi:MAG: LacI family DNA-binding transcriptional regulator [Opitutales bacterium]
MAKGKPTIQSIAREARVSRMTVSRALRNAPTVNPETLRKVQAVAKKQGYVPDPRISELMAHLRRDRSNRSRENIGLVHLCNAETAYKDLSPSEDQMVRGIRARAGELGYFIDYVSCNVGAPEWRKLMRVLINRGIRGVIVLVTRVIPETIPDISHWDDTFFMVLAGRASSFLRAPSVTNNHHFTMTTALRELEARQYRRIGLYLTERTHYGVQESWHAVWVAAQRRHQLDHPALFNVVQQFDRDDFQAWVNREEPDVVVTNHRATPDWLAEMNLRIPEDIGYCNVDCSDLKGVSGICQKQYAIGEAALEILSGNLFHNDKGKAEAQRQLLIQGNWVEGNSLRPARSVNGRKPAAS